MTFDGTELVFGNMPWEITLNTANSRVELNGQTNDVSTQINGYGGNLVQRWDDGYTYIDGGGLIVGNTTSTTTDGLIRATNDIIAFYSSDKRLKENIKNISNPLKKLAQINGVEFDWKEFEEK